MSKRSKKIRDEESFIEFCSRFSPDESPEKKRSQRRLKDLKSGNNARRKPKGER